MSVQFDSVRWTSFNNTSYVSGIAIVFIKGLPNTDTDWNRQIVSFLAPRDNNGTPFTLERPLDTEPSGMVWPATFHTEGVNNNHGWGIDNFGFGPDDQNLGATRIDAKVVVRGPNATMVRIGFLAIIPGVITLTS